jgi:hypothetical protein
MITYKCGDIYLRGVRLHDYLQMWWYKFKGVRLSDYLQMWWYKLNGHEIMWLLTNVVI